MSEHHIADLHLRPEIIQRACQFLKQYADLCVEESAPLITREDTPPEAVNDNGRLPSAWGRLAEAATSYFEAGQWAVLFDPPLALRMWQLASEIYRRLNFGFGYYLNLTTTGAVEFTSDRAADDTLIADQMWRNLRDVMVASRVVDEELDHPEPRQLSGPLRYPQQQTYLLLTGASLIGQEPASAPPEVVSGEVLYSMVVRSPHYFGVTPVGALGLPIKNLWQLAANLIQPTEKGADEVVDLIGDLSRRYDTAIQQAMTNEYLWKNAASPVDVGSFDIASIVMNAYQVFGSELLEARIDQIQSDLPPLGRAQVEMAFDLAQAAQNGKWRN